MVRTRGSAAAGQSADDTSRDAAATTASPPPAVSRRTGRGPRDASPASRRPAAKPAAAAAATAPEPGSAAADALPQSGLGAATGRRAAVALLLSLAVIPSAALAAAYLPPGGAVQLAVLKCACVSAGAFAATAALVPVVARYTLRKGMFGLDLNKAGTPGGAARVPEALGLAPGIAYLVAVILFQTAHLQPDSDWLVEYNAALASVCFMLLLGFMDDVLDVPWRIKLALPAVAALPLLMAYAGGTDVLLPKLLRPVFGFGVLRLGWCYKLYMLLVAVFCTNSINILAGVNGLEAGQALLLAGGLSVHNLTQLAALAPGGSLAPAVGAGPAAFAAAAAATDAQLFSLFFAAPLLFVTAGLLLFNWHPSQVFVGDTFTYFAGMALAVAGLLGHCSETMLLFFAPQVANFIYSLPQLLKLVPCPRHRLPRHDPATGLLHATPNYNLVNLTLHVLGPMNERALTVTLLALQAACIAAGFAARGLLAGIYK